MPCYEDIKSGIIGKVQSTHIDGRFTYKTTKNVNGEIDEGVYIIYNESPKITRAGDKSYTASKKVATTVQKAIERDYPGVKVFITPQDFNQVVRFKVVPQAELINKYLAQENFDGFSYQITNNPKDTSPRVLNDNIMSYYNLKEEVIEAKKKQLEKYKIRESAKKNTSAYRDFVLNLDEEIKTLENELAQLNVNDITNVLDFFDKDLDDLINFLDIATDEQIKNNYNILKQVANDFSVLITGRDFQNNEYYNYKIDFNQFTRGGSDSGANWSQCDEVTPNDATDYNVSGTLNNTDLFNCAPSGINSYDTVNVVHVGDRFSNIVADGTAQHYVLAEKTSSGTVATGAVVGSLNSTTWRSNGLSTTAFNPYGLTMYRDPDGSAWTQSTLDSMQIGYQITTGGSNGIAVSTVWAMVDYTPGTPPTGGSPTNKFLLGVG